MTTRLARKGGWRKSFREGQAVVARQGLYVPLTAALAREELARLE